MVVIHAFVLLFFVRKKTVIFILLEVHVSEHHPRFLQDLLCSLLDRSKESTNGYIFLHCITAINNNIATSYLMFLHYQNKIVAV